MAEDAGGAATTGPWIRPSDLEEQYPQPILDLMGWDAAAWQGAAAPEYPCLIDERHELTRLYGIVNVPAAVWIDEDGRIVRSPEPAGVSEAFKAIDLASFSMPPDAIEAGSQVRNRYFALVRDWVRRGSDSPAVLAPDEVLRRMGGDGGAGGGPALAAAHFRVGGMLYRGGHPEAAQHHFAEAVRLWPENWPYQRQARQLAQLETVGELDAGPEFWSSLDARGAGAFYPPLDLPATA